MIETIEALRDVRVIIPLVALLAALLFFRYNLSSKGLHWEIVSRSPLFSIEKAVRDHFEVYYDGARVDHLTVLVIRFLNSGTKAISEEDYREPIVLDFGETARILEVELTAARPECLSPKVTNEGRSLVIAPLLLNKGDRFTLTFKVDSIGAISVRSRIEDVEQITGPRPWISPKNGIMETVFLCGMATLIALGSLALFSTNRAIGISFLAMTAPMLVTMLGDLLDSERLERNGMGFWALSMGLVAAGWACYGILQVIRALL